MRKTAVVITLALLWVSAKGAGAHDFWIEPTTFAPRPSEVVQLALKVGDDFKGKPIPRDDSKIRAFTAVGPDGESVVVGRDGADPAGLLRPATPGVQIVGYRSHRSHNNLESGRFELYLLDEGLQRIVELRKQRGESQRPGSEVYSRCAKSLLAVGRGSLTGYERPLGLSLEIIPENSPWERAGGEPLRIRLLFEGRPLPGALVTAMNRSSPEDGVARRTDGEGCAHFPINDPGVWMIKTVHMVEAPQETGADWESLWASITFQLEKPGERQVTSPSPPRD